MGGTERAIVDGATNLQQEIGAASRPSHLLRFIHSAVHQEIGGPFGDSSSNSQSGTMALGVIDQPVALAVEITIQRLQGGPQLSRGPVFAATCAGSSADRAVAICFRCWSRMPI